MNLNRHGSSGLKLIKSKDYFFLILARFGFYDRLPDDVYLKRLFKAMMGKELDLDNPQTFNEKLQWLKLYDRNPLYTQLVDKFEVRKYIADTIGEEYLIPLLGVWNSFDEIDFDNLPDQFVLKCTHDSGGLIICRDKSRLDIAAAREKINKCLNRNYYWFGREWPYKNVKPRVIAEKYMVDESGIELKDYKFFCFDGMPKALFIATDRGLDGEETKFDFYDTDFNHLPIINGHNNAYRKLLCPPAFDKMKEISAKLSRNMYHVRIDLYDINGEIYFGEMTFFHWSGLKPFEPEEWDYTFGSWIVLPNKKISKTGELNQTYKRNT